MAFPCEKCGYLDRKNKKVSKFFLCILCSGFAPKGESELKSYVSEKVDWKNLEIFRKNQNLKKEGKKEGMLREASKGKIVTRAPYGYSVIEGRLQLNENSSKVYSLYSTFISKEYSLNSLAKNFSLSLNGLKKVLTNRTYLGEIKFDSKIYKGTHKPLIPQDLFYAVQRKLKEKFPRKGLPK